MHVEVIPIKELSENLKQSWLDFQSSNPNLSRPCFHPELFIAAGEFIPNIYIALIYESNSLTGLLPFQMDKSSSTAKPIEFCDYSAIIGPPSRCWDINVILKKAGLKVWEFRLLADFKNIKSKVNEYQTIVLPRVDLSGGFENYLTFQKQREISFKNIMYKKRIIERDIGSIRFIANCNDTEVFHRILQWKTIRHNRNLDWLRLATGILEHIYYLKESLLSGVLSALYADDNLLAGLFCLRYQGIMHLLIITFNPSFSKYSVGELIVYYQLSEFKKLQYQIFEFGSERGEYKWYFSNSTSTCIRGTFKANYSFKERIKSIPWLYQGFLPLLRTERKIMANLKNNVGIYI